VLSKTAEYTPGISASIFAKDVNSRRFELHYQSGGIDERYIHLYREKYSRIDPLTTNTLLRGARRTDVGG